MGNLDLVIRQASLRGRAGRFDVGVSDGPDSDHLTIHPFRTRAK
jgi:hypothetical protein